MSLLQRGRVRLLGVATGVVMVTAIGLSTAVAQDTNTPATPGAGSDAAQATPATGSDNVPPPTFNGSAEAKTALAEQSQKVLDTIAAVQKDRDSVKSGADLTAVDDLLTKANKFAADAKLALSSDDISGAPVKLIAAEQTAMAAEELIRAQLTSYGLPSQQAGASRTLVAAYNSIDELTKPVGSSDSEDAKALLTSAQSLYKSAYDLYGAGTYAQAAATARVAAQVGRISSVLTGKLAMSANVEPGAIPFQGDGRKGRIEKRTQRGPGGAGIALPGDEGFGMITPNDGAFWSNDLPDGQVVIVDGSGPGLEFGTQSGIFSNGGDFSSESPLEVPAPNFD